MLRYLAPAAVAWALLVTSSVHAEEAGQEPPSAQDVETITSCLGQAGDAPSSCIGRLADPCMETKAGQSTIGTGECLMREQGVWDKLLNERYAASSEDAKRMDSDRATADRDVFSSLLKAQRAWIAYRDAECGRLYAYWQDGTIRSVVFATCMRDLTAQRAIDLAPQTP